MLTVMADKSQLIQFIQSLSDNTIKFRGKETPRVHISVTRGSEIRDRGSGVRDQES